jgi:hypothetical protein
MSLHIKHIRRPTEADAAGDARAGSLRAQPAVDHRADRARVSDDVPGLPLLTFLPVFAREIFHGDVTLYTHMMAFSGRARSSARSSSRGSGGSSTWGCTLLVVQAIFGALIVAFALSRVWWWSCLLLFCAARALMSSSR